MKIGQHKSPETVLREALEVAHTELLLIQEHANGSVSETVLTAVAAALAAVPALPPIPHGSEIEKRIVGRLVTDLLAAGYGISVFDGEEFPITECREAEIIFKAMSSTDTDTLYVHKPHGKSTVLLVWGNDCHVISDYSISLEAVLAGANALADELEG